MTVRVKVGLGLQVIWRKEVQGKRMVFVTVLVVREGHVVGEAVAVLVVAVGEIELAVVVLAGVVAMEEVVVKVMLEVLVELAVEEDVVFAEVVLDTTELLDPPPPPQLPTADTWSLMSDTPPERAYNPP